MWLIILKFYECLLSFSTQVNLRQQEEISNLMGKIIVLESRLKKATVENAELQSHLSAAQEAQRNLTSEVKNNYKD